MAQSILTRNWSMKSKILALSIASGACFILILLSTYRQGHGSLISGNLSYTTLDTIREERMNQEPTDETSNFLNTDEEGSYFNRLSLEEDHLDISEYTLGEDGPLKSVSPNGEAASVQEEDHIDVSKHAMEEKIEEEKALNDASPDEKTVSTQEEDHLDKPDHTTGEMNEEEKTLNNASPGEENVSTQEEDQLGRSENTPIIEGGKEQNTNSFEEEDALSQKYLKTLPFVRYPITPESYNITCKIDPPGYTQEQADFLFDPTKKFRNCSAGKTSFIDIVNK